jgi:excinuclease ABC subunit A
VNDILGRALSRHFYRSLDKPGDHETITGMEHIDKVIIIDQSPIGRTPRSNPATYTGVFQEIRDIFAQTEAARARGYQPGRFSFNVKGGRCEACQGDGMVKIEMHFLPDVYVPCEVCKGMRYNKETLEVRYHGKNISEILMMTVEEAAEIFQHVPPIERKLRTLVEVGLSYIQLGQSATTLSGGEAQRVKLATELSARSTGRTLYLLDEPTTGLHADDIRKLLSVLQQLSDAGNTVIVIEHNLDVIKVADHIIDLGPGGGEQGGRIVAEGTPEEVAENPESFTGKFLRPLLKRAPAGHLAVK